MRRLTIQSSMVTVEIYKLCSVVHNGHKDCKCLKMSGKILVSGSQENAHI
ncbi:MAG: hypothetical protein J5989_09910 [Alistipes sp.]|nr:hypothetical protein [Alistipes sp.]